MQYTSYYQKLVPADSKADSTTHYLNDGDSFDYAAVGALSDLSSFSMYDQVYLGLHGSSSVADQYGLGGSLYTKAQLLAAANNIVGAYGCQPLLQLLPLRLLPGSFMATLEAMERLTI